ncbi:hypothetical protein J1N35_008157 [Gossypium stocksii]|uniref:Reverse transcriptase zinc-binding domain-containing protein n=1 Tax=Gossypium stocksii TaxID=47602 RepID=A0A9D4AFV6_9ROSI|nr:hypothetical protein J1N35_008157 [Gossypium stocksii]
MMKLGFKLVTEPITLWVQVLQGKYKVTNKIPDYLSRSRCSFLWKALTKVWPLIRGNLLWSIRDGRNVRCWQDPWVPNTRLLVNLIPSHSNLDLDCLLSEMVSDNDTWNLDLFWVWLLEMIVCKIIGVLPTYPTAGVDKIIRGGMSTGSFSIKSAYRKIQETF